MIKNLVFDIEYPEGYLTANPILLPFITLQPNTALKSFSFAILFVEEHFEDSDEDFDFEPTSYQISDQPFLPWYHLLQTAPSGLRLVTITMDCYALHKNSMRDWFDLSDSSKWSDLDIILANLPLLQKVTFYVNLPDTDRDQSDSVEEDDDDSESSVEDGYRIVSTTSTAFIARGGSIFRRAKFKTYKTRSNS